MAENHPWIQSELSPGQINWDNFEDNEMEGLDFHPAEKAIFSCGINTEERAEQPTFQQQVCSPDSRPSLQASEPFTDSGVICRELWGLDYDSEEEITVSYNRDTEERAVSPSQREIFTPDSSLSRPASEHSSTTAEIQLSGPSFYSDEEFASYDIDIEERAEQSSLQPEICTPDSTVSQQTSESLANLETPLSKYTQPEGRQSQSPVAGHSEYIQSYRKYRDSKDAIYVKKRDYRGVKMELKLEKQRRLGAEADCEWYSTQLREVEKYLEEERYIRFVCEKTLHECNERMESMRQTSETPATSSQSESRVASISREELEQEFECLEERNAKLCRRIKKIKMKKKETNEALLNEVESLRRQLEEKTLLCEQLQELKESVEEQDLVREFKETHQSKGNTKKRKKKKRFFIWRHVRIGRHPCTRGWFTTKTGPPT